MYNASIDYAHDASSERAGPSRFCIGGRHPDSPLIVRDDDGHGQEGEGGEGGDGDDGDRRGEGGVGGGGGGSTRTLEGRIAAGEFKVVIYGSAARTTALLPLVSRHLPRSRIGLIYGEDLPLPLGDGLPMAGVQRPEGSAPTLPSIAEASRWGTVFARELLDAPREPPWTTQTIMVPGLADRVERGWREPMEFALDQTPEESTTRADELDASDEPTTAPGRLRAAAVEVSSDGGTSLR